MRLLLPDLRNGYVQAVQAVLEQGRPVEVRGYPTLECLDVTLEVLDPTDCVPLGVGRQPNLKIAAVEALQLIGGVSHPELMVKAAGVFGNYRDGGIFHGAYGTRVRAQLPVVVERLKIDPETRQACVVLWDPMQDLMVPDSADYPCTIMLQFLIRDGALQLHTTMRSNDVWLGLAYDGFQFTQLQLTVASILGIPVGSYFHHAVSMHVYERDIEKASALFTSNDANDGLRAKGLPSETMFEAMTTARHLLKSNQFADTGWYNKVLEPLWKE